MNKGKITSHVMQAACEYGINYIAQTTNTKGNIHFIYSHTGVTDSDTVCLWKMKYKK